MAIIFVNGSVTGGSDDGSTWGNAYTDLGTALVNANSGDEIWVAQGTYTPGANQSDTFTIDKDIALYGGFSGNGTETSLDERDFEANPTILSGEIGEDGLTSDNIHHVVTAQSTSNQARIDGVIIQGGSTESVSDDSNDDGAGLYNQSGGLLILENVIIQDNIAADDGGGIRNDGTLTIYNSTVSSNTANASSSSTSGGGGLINTTSGDLTIISSTFSGNTSQKNGGAIRNDGTLTIVGSTLSGNTAEESGGGLINTVDINNGFVPATATIAASTITNNDAQNISNSGGGDGLANFGTLTIGNTIIAGNTNNNDVLNIVSPPFVNGTITSEGSNLIGGGNAATSFSGTGDQTSITDPGLDPLADNGGFTETHALQADSPALNSGNNNIAVNLSESALGVDLNNDGDTGDTIATVGDLVTEDGVTVSIGGFEVQECFLAGTLILTEDGEKSVEALKIGDRLQTLSGQIEPIKWIGQQTYHRATAHPLRSHPIQIKPGALGGNLPQRDLFVSPDHALLVDGLLINAGALTNGASIVQVQPTAERFTYYHIELHHHALILAEGAAAESYLPQTQSRDTFHNGDEYATLYPEKTIMSLLPMNYPRVSSKRQLPRFVSKRLEYLGRSLYPMSCHPSAC